MEFEGELVRLCDLEPLIQLWWLVRGDVVQLRYILCWAYVGVGMMMQLKCIDSVNCETMIKM